MADRFYGYQYDTNPRKIMSDNSYYDNRYPQNKKPVTTTNRNYSYNEKNDLYKADYINNRKSRHVKTKEQEREALEKTYRYKNKQVDNNEFNNDDFKNNDNKSSKRNAKGKLRIVGLILASFTILFAVSYQNSLISESFNKKEQYKKELESLSKTNQQIEVGIENNLNLNNVEQVAKEKLGMQKLNNEQKIYVNLPKEDYVAPAVEQVIIEENENFFVKLFKGFTNVLK